MKIIDYGYDIFVIGIGYVTVDKILLIAVIVVSAVYLYLLRTQERSALKKKRYINLNHSMKFRRWVWGIWGDLCYSLYVKNESIKTQEEHYAYAQLEATTQDINYILPY